MIPSSYLITRSNPISLSSNKKFETQDVEILHFENGKIKEAWTVFDTFSPP